MTDSEDPDQVYRAACVQFDVRPGDVAANLAAMVEGIAEAVDAGARLCVLPEMWSTSFATTFPPALLDEAAAAERRLADLSAEHDLVVVGSAIEQVGGDAFNTARVYDGGTLRGTYRKIHLFSPNSEHKNHTAGDTPLVVETRLGTLGVMICYDIRFPELGRYYFHRGVEVLVVPGQWPEARAQHWRTLLRARAIENEMFVVGCNRTGQEPSLKTGEAMAFPGDGRIVDPTGEVLAAGSGEAGAVIGEIERRKVRTMHRILPVERDQRPTVYRRLFDECWATMTQKSREGQDLTESDED